MKSSKMVLPAEDLANGVRVAVGKKHSFQVTNLQFRLRFPLDSTSAKGRSECFTLTGHGTGRTYSQAKRLDEDAIEGDQCVDLVFDNLIPRLSYSMQVDSMSTGESYTLFQDLACAEMKKTGGKSP